MLHKEKLKSGTKLPKSTVGTCEARTRKQYASLEHKKQHEMRMMRLTIIYCISAMKYLDIKSLMFMVIFTGGCRGAGVYHI